MTKNMQTKRKEKVFLTIPWTRRFKSEITKSSLRRGSLIFIAAFVFVTIGLGSNTLPYAWNVLRCGRLPVESSRFAAAYSYKLPGDAGYGVHIFSEYHFCTEADIKATNGYHRNVFTDAAKKEADELRVKREEAARFSLSKVDYRVYVPRLKGYEVSQMRVSAVDSNTYTFYRVKKNGTVIGQIRELKSNDSYNICSPNDDPNERYCKVIGHDGAGREVSREYDNGIRGWKSYFTGINIDGTGIVLSIDDDREAIKILSSMVLFTEQAQE